MEFSSLEKRLFLNAGSLVEPMSWHEVQLAYDMAADINPLIQAASTVSYGSAEASGAISPLSAIPALNSDPSAKAQLYLDFDGEADSTWGDYSVSATPAYDRDGDATTFSSSELADIEEIWARVAEKYSPFNINVTTVNPGALTDRVALRVVIGGDGAWSDMLAGGIGYVGSFYNDSPNTVYVFSDNLGTGEPKYIAEAAAHEAGHGFGLEHQSSYGTYGQLLEEYSTGSGSVAPIMGNSYDARGVWWSGTSTSAWTRQDDMRVIANSMNGFGYRTDDYGNSAALASPLSVDGSEVSASGIIERMTDSDYFSFTTGAGTIDFSIDVAAKGAMLDLKAVLLKADGTVVATANTASLGETLMATVPAGSYRLAVMSHGRYGDVGQYTITGTIVPGMAEIMAAPEAPTGLVARPMIQGRMRLLWNPSSDATGYIVERSSDGATWDAVGATMGTETWYTDRGLTPGKTYSYRVRATNEGGASTPSEVISTTAAITTRMSPGHVQMVMRSRYVMRLTWQDNSTGESGFEVQWSPDGRHWYTLKRVSANRTGTNVPIWRRGTTYFRVRAYNGTGLSAFSGVTSTAAARGATVGVFSERGIEEGAGA
ncbi:MAG: fibronectin type III domain-containing protein [Bacillota bacterium]